MSRIKIARLTALTSLLAFTPTLLPISVASAEVMIVGIDRKFAYDDQGRRQALAPGHDEIQVFDLVDPAQPKLIGTLPLENSIVGPPTNLAVTPDGRLALIANSVHSEKAETPTGWKSTPADELFVVDLAARPLRLVKTLKVGAQPSGVAISADGKLALVANREGKSVSVLRIQAGDVTLAETIEMKDAIASVAITPDSRHAIAVKFSAHKAALLDIDADGKVTYPGRDLTVGLWPYTVAISPDGKTALVGNTGNMATSDGNADTVSVIDLAAEPPRTVDHVTVGDAPEGVIFNPNGGTALIGMLNGSYDAPKDAWYRHGNGMLVSLKLAEGRVKVVGTVAVGSFPEGIAFSANGAYAYAGNFGSNSITVLRVGADGTLTDTGHDVSLSGPPAALRVRSQ